MPASSSADVDVRIASIAAGQHGLFTCDQAIKTGATRGFICRRLQTRRWELCYRKVYRLRGTPRTWEQSLMAACLASREGVVSHRAAAALWEFPGFSPGPIEITTPRARRFRGDFTVHQSMYLLKGDRTLKGVIAVTTPLRTLVDLAASVSKDALEEALDDALVRGLVTIPRVDRWLENLPSPVPGVGPFKEAVDGRRQGGTPESVMETRMLRLLRSRGLPEPERQYRIARGGRLILRADFAYPAERIAIEMDSFGFHARTARWQRDLAKTNELIALGWRVFRFTWDDLRHRPETVCETVRGGLGRAIENPVSGGA